MWKFRDNLNGANQMQFHRGFANVHFSWCIKRVGKRYIAPRPKLLATPIDFRLAMAKIPHARLRLVGPSVHQRWLFWWTIAFGSVTLKYAKAKQTSWEAKTFRPSATIRHATWDPRPSDFTDAAAVLVHNSLHHFPPGISLNICDEEHTNPDILDWKYSIWFEIPKQFLGYVCVSAIVYQYREP